MQTTQQESILALIAAAASADKRDAWKEAHETATQHQAAGSRGTHIFVRHPSAVLQLAIACTDAGPLP
jgi:hypothetical protein